METPSPVFLSRSGGPFDSLRSLRAG